MAESIFRRACEMPATERLDFVRDACGEDAPLLAAVRMLLEHDERPAIPLDSPLGSAIRQYGEALFDEAATAPTMPRQIGPYRILRRIGEGGFGIVYLAEQSNPRRVVALKVLRSFHTGRELLRRFEYEAHILGRLQHPGIAQIFEAGVASIGGTRQPFYAMEYIAGANLVEFARENGLSTSERMRLFAQMCDALQHAHQRGVIHRDLKPANILVIDEVNHPAAPLHSADAATMPAAVSRTFQPKILDFGVARLVEESTSPNAVTAPHTTHGQLVGTLAYMSPEQIAGDVGQIDTRSDVYSAGVLLFELLTGRLPYDVREQGLAQAARIIVEEPPASLSSIDRTLRGDVQAIVEKALQKDKSRRYQSAADFAADIRRYLSGEPIEAKRDSALYLLRKNAQRYRGAIAAASLLILTLSVFNAVTYRQARENNRLAIEAQQQRNRAGTEAANLRQTLYFSRIANAQTAIMLQNDVTRATETLSLAPAELRGWEWRHLHKLINQSRRAIPCPGVRPGCASLSGDDRLLAATNMEAIVTLWDFESGKKLLEIHPASPRARLSFNPDGSLLAIADDNGEISLFDVNRAEVRALLIPPYELDTFTDRETRKVAFDETGNKLVALARSGRVSVFDIPSLSLERTFRTRGFAQTFTLLDQDSKILVGGTDGHLTLWSLADASFIRSFAAYDAAVMNLDFSPQLDLIAVATERGLRTLNPRTGLDREVGVMDLDAITWAEFTSDGYELIAGGRDRVLQIYNARTRERRRLLRGHPTALSYCTMTADGCSFVTGDRSQGWLIWDDDAQQDVPVVECEQHMLQSMRFSPDGSLIATGGNTGDIKLWDRRTLTLRSRITNERDTVHSLCFSHDGRHIAAARGAQPTRIHEIGTGRIVAELPPADDRTSGVAFSSDDQRLFVTDNGGSLAAWDIPSARNAWTIRAHSAGKTVVRVSPTRPIVATAGADGFVRLRDAADGNEIRSFSASEFAVYDVAFAPDGESVATVDRYGGVRTWRTATGEMLIECGGHRGAARGCVFSPDGARLVTCGADGVLRVWDTVTRDEVITLTGAKRTVETVDFSPDGRTIISGGEDFVMRVWDSDPSPPAAITGSR